MGAIPTKGVAVEGFPELRMGFGLLTDAEASTAAAAAKFVIAKRNQLDFVDFVSIRNPDTGEWLGPTKRRGVLHLGWWDPAVYPNYSELTIWSYPELATGILAPLVGAAEKIIEFSGIENPNRLSLYYSRGPIVLKEHQDFLDYRRTLAVLDGTKELTFRATDSGIVRADTQNPGDAYEMQFTSDESSLHHSVRVVSPNGHITAYVDSEDENGGPALMPHTRHLRLRELLHA